MALKSFTAMNDTFWILSLDSRFSAAQAAARLKAAVSILGFFCFSRAKENPKKGSLYRGITIKNICNSLILSLFVLSLFSCLFAHFAGGVIDKGELENRGLAT